ncbi:hypothetical protein C7401_12670 [Paraburkholderia unamae]|uniref:GPW/gp25 family protein n=1 Tax=Paraburkholderia unamae TaxID=219649 RepID=UPI000DC433AF|nr:GPW/gp25 family protein [Paraburkholderia unamae]RAR53896.1 hypothetical protein C7401_12670 [Paraburkholderia unamae]
MKGMNHSTGVVVSGVSHLYQSIARILTTPIGSCVARREFGSDLPDLVDAPNNGTVRVQLYAATAAALMRWEPRLTLTRVQLASDTDELGAGIQVMDIEGYATDTGDAVETTVTLSTSEAA